ncbi:hypothetical protein M0805_006411 [Coniferiporia weirii]|nr:hypothetical protein M0805_006411 [Coniferiporia weirii]
MSTKTLDHIVYLTPPGFREETVKQWERLGFKVTPGGTHAGGLTENALVIISDSTYIELISFTHPPEHYPVGSPERAARDVHPWAGKGAGWIDFALLGFGSSNPASAAPDPPTSVDPDSPSDGILREVDLADLINERSAREGSGVVYDPTVDGGRIRPDGQELRWRIVAPEIERHGRGTLPFFCGDVTDRGLRVPVSDTTIDHPNAVVGVAQLRLFAPATAYPQIAKQITTVVGFSPVASSHTESSWELGTPMQVGSGGNAHIGRQGVPAPRLVLGVAEAQPDTEETTGIGEVTFWATRGYVEAEEVTYGKLSIAKLE